MSGRHPVGAVIDVADHMARFFLERGEAEQYTGNVAPTGGEAQPSFVSPVAPALTQTMPEQSSDGAKKRGRPKKNPAE